MWEVEAVEQVRLVLDAAERGTPQPVQARRWMAALASTIFSFFRMGRHGDLVARDHGNLREQGAGRLPALLQPQAWL